MPLDAKRAAAIAVEIASLRDLDLDGLRARWHSLRGRPAPKHLPKHLLLRVLAYDLQAAVLGDLDFRTKQYLERVAADPDKVVDLPTPAASGPRPGTILVREWAGRLCRVTVLEQGFAWNGCTYRSLSEVARVITATRWNGRRFFGLPAVSK
ncbi:MAG TPA: DUF2924 domain-containing protein [Amaricoccus sp.]|nr:DUF2924 domain-containing protein [Amaricoccus sp.]HMR54495.1 DUF2924 domain-containing protein [Amaricoccus sp.]HMU00798.1 DUF2924 domain-containing protein [Amaricoccus sp.]